MDRNQAYKLVHELTRHPNLIKHMLAVEAIMRALCGYFWDKGVLSDEEKLGMAREALVDLWGIAGLVHDADYEQFKDTEPKKHPSVIFEELEKRNTDPRIIAAVRSHAWGWREDLPKPITYMEWSLYCSDELSGLITACALVRPDKKLESVNVDSVMKKFPVKSFAAGATRENIMQCEQHLGLPLAEFVGIALKAMQNIHQELGL